ncbi:hypothetical protein ACU8KH_04660 [Lachancea thermotolerans]
MLSSRRLTDTNYILSQAKFPATGVQRILANFKNQELCRNVRPYAKPNLQKPTNSFYLRT